MVTGARSFHQIVDKLMCESIGLSLVASVTLSAASASGEIFTVASRSIADEKAVFATVKSVSVVPTRSPQPSSSK
jgi:hypothetical protein